MKEKKNINVRVGNNIKRERERAGYTQERFSELIGIGPKSLSAIERGTVGISLSALCRVCQVLTISSDLLLFENDTPECPSDLAIQMGRLSPEQYKIAKGIMYKLFEAFALETDKE